MNRAGRSEPDAFFPERNPTRTNNGAAFHAEADAFDRALAVRTPPLPESKSATGNDTIPGQRVAAGGLAHPAAGSADEPGARSLLVKVLHDAALDRETRHRGGDRFVERVLEIAADVGVDASARETA